MPLEHSSSPGAFKRNVANLMHEVGKSPHVKSPQQALAIAYETQRRGHADGGVAGPPLPTPDPRTQGFLVGAINDYASKVGRQPENFTTGDIEKIQRQYGVTGGRPQRANGGVAGYASGGNASPWEMRQEIRGMHSGPIMSSVPGRTDHLPLSVASGSFVLPSTHVASMGQGNTMAGFAHLNKMFGNSGPYGIGKNMPIARGMGAPKAPALPKLGLSQGGGRGDGAGTPVDIMAAGGEYVIPPEIVKRIGGGDIKHGHNILDAWVMKRRKHEIKTQQKLPPPAKR